MPPRSLGSVRIARALLPFAALMALVLPAAARAGQERPATARSSVATAAVPGRLIVEWQPGADRGERLAARADADAALVRTLGDPQFQLLRPAPGQSVADALAQLRADPAVRSATRDTLAVLHATTNDPLIGQLWGLQNLGLGVHGVSGALGGADLDALPAWDRTRGTPTTVIADLDSGYRFEHPDLAPVAWTNPADPPDGADNDGNGIVDDSHGADFVGSEADAPTADGDPTDDDLIDGGHGVHTAGTIGAAGNNGIGISGVAQDVRIMPLRVCAFSTSELEGRCPTSSQIAAINYAGAHGARAANMSLGGTVFNPAVRDAFAANPGVLFVISAGNDAEDNEAAPHYPCGYDPSTSGIAGAVDNVVCVAATDQADGLASFSDWGARSVDVGAPGTEILSTYPSLTAVDETFAADDFASKWSASGRDGGFARTNEAPLAGFGMSDSPGAAPVARSVRESTSAGVGLPAGMRSCKLQQTRELSVGAGTYSYSVLLDGVVIDGLSGATSSDTVVFELDDADVARGGMLQLRFRYVAGPAPASSDGAWIDDVKFTCMEAVGQASGYDFLEGTSMAAPHVTGAAGLLFSLNPSASVAQVRAALLATVHPLAALAGKTSSGGRVDAAAALDEIRAPDTRIDSGPSRTTRSRRATFAFARADAALPTSFECQLDGGAFAACASPTTITVNGGRHTFAVRAKSPHGVVADASPATATWTVTQCTVPKLNGKSLRRARRALRRARCKLGKAKRPRGLRSARGLVVKSSKPRAGALRTDGAKVKLKLVRPRPRHGRRGRHRRHGGRR